MMRSAGMLTAVVGMALCFCGGSRESALPSGESSSPSESSGATTPEPPPEGVIERLRRERWTGDIDGLAERRFIRALVHPQHPVYMLDGAEQHGLVYEMVRTFEDFLNKKLRRGHLKIQFVFIPVRGDQLIPYLLDGRGDIIVNPMTITAERQAQVDFCTPFADDMTKIVVTGPNAPALATLDDLSGKELYYRQSHSFHQELLKLNQRFMREGKPAMKLRAADEHLEDSDVLEMLNAGLIPLSVSNNYAVAIWSQVFSQIKPREDLVISSSESLAWAVSKKSPKLRQLANEFATDNRVGSKLTNVLLQKYRNIKWVKNAKAEAEMKKFRATVDFFQKYGAQYDFDYLLLAAQGYQESGLDQKRRSPAGAVGVMQIKPSTAAQPPVKIRNVTRVDNNILAGTRYLHFIVNDYYMDEPMDRFNKMLFAFASYNAGPTRVQGLREEAQRLGLDPNQWFGNVEIVAAKRIGRETVQYVSNIYKYYITYKLMQDAEREKAKSATR